LSPQKIPKAVVTTESKKQW